MKVSLIKHYDKTWTRVTTIDGRFIGFLSPGYLPNTVTANVDDSPRDYSVPAFIRAISRDTENSHYCRHGNYVGHPYGPDFICGPCEDGD